MTERSFLAELKRRNVIRVAIAYVAVSWLVLQAGSLIFQAMDLPNIVLRGLLAVLVVGFIPAMVFSWVYELTPEGLKRESEIDRDESITHLTGRRLDYLVIGVMAAVIGLLLFDRFVLVPRHAARVAASQPAAGPQPVVQPAATQPPAEAAPEKLSIAVLPFVNMSSDKEQEYFSDGISEELLNLLAKIPKLRVTARTSSFSFKGKEIGIKEIAKTLNVAHILEGSVRKSGNEVRITAQLIDTRSDAHLWSQTYDRKLDDIFAIQDEIAADVVKELKIALLGAAPKARATDPEAYGLYLQAVQIGRTNTLESLERSDALLRRVLEIDPRYAPAWNELARNSINGLNTGLIEHEQGFAQAREAAEKALAIDPDYPAPYARLGSISLQQGDLAAAVREMESGLARGPTDPDVLRATATLLRSLGRLDESGAVNEALARMDPVNTSMLNNLSVLQRISGRFDDSIATSRVLLGLNPGRGSARGALAMTLLLKGDVKAAVAEAEQEPSVVWRRIALPMVYHAAGRKAEAELALAELLRESDGSEYNVAYVYVFRGDADKAFEWLEKAVANKDPGLAGIANDNLFDPIKSDPRWLPFLRRIGRAPEQLAKIEFKVDLSKLEGAGSTDSNPPTPKP